MTLSQIFLIVRSRWLSALVVFALVVGAIVGLSLALPRQYTATASVVLDVKSPDPIAGVVLPGMVASGYMATQVDVVQSERVMRRAIESLQLDKNPLRRAEWQEATDGQGDFEAWMAEEVQKKMSARPGKDSNVILVSYTARDPKAASAMANAVVKAYIDTTVELRTEPARQYNVAFEESTRNLRAALESAQSKLSAFQQREGILVNDERLDVENERLSQLSTQATELQAVANESAGRQSQAGERGSNMSEALSNQTISLLATDLARQQAKLNELESRYGDQHPQIVEMRANVKELRTRLDAERGRITSSLTVNNTVNQSRLQSVRNDLATQRAKVLRIKGLRDESAVLLRDVENAQREYDAAFAKRSQSTLESQTTQTNVSILKTATPPAFASSPRMSLNLAVALLLGAGLALATAIFRERLDWRLRSDTDVIELLKQPLLGVLPDRPNTYLPSSRRRSMQAVANRVLGRQPLLGR